MRNTSRYRLRSVGAALVAATLPVTLIVTTASPAAASASLTRVGTYTSVSYGWAQVEHWQDTNPSWPVQQYLPDGRDDQSGQRATFFGTSEPPGSDFLLYYAPGWNTPTHATPVLLVMGANDNVDREYADPGLNGAGTCGALSCPSTGLMQYLSGQGYAVFAVDFANIQGDNLQWAQSIADALQVVRSRTGASQVDVVAWSKGAFAARMYAANVMPSWGTGYAGDVRKLLLLGNPNGGLDYVFAHGTEGDVSIYPECGGSLNGPSPHVQYLCYGVFYNHPELSIYNDSGYDTYAGQRQMLARWDGTYGVDESQQDWYTTYYGGQGYVSYGYGIDYAINQGSLVAQIQGASVSAATYLLCGGDPDMPGFYNENRGPSDGLVFEASCEDSTGLPNLVATTLIATDNHLMLGWDSAAEQQVASWLG